MSVSVAVAVLFSLMVGLTIYSPHLGLANWSNSQKNNVALTNLAPISTKINNYELSTSFAIQTNASDAEWAASNKNGLYHTLLTQMSMVNPSELRSPNGVIELQDSMTKVINSTYNTNRVKGVYITNLALQPTSH